MKSDMLVDRFAIVMAFIVDVLFTHPELPSRRTRNEKGAGKRKRRIS
jgi:hypothetical protein